MIVTGGLGVGGPLVTLGIGLGPEQTPTPTPTPTQLPGAGNAAGEGHRYRSSADTYADIERWTRRGTAIRVKALPISQRLPQHEVIARARLRVPQAQYVVAKATPSARTQMHARCLVAIRRIRVGAQHVRPTLHALPGVATAKATERQDMEDVITIVELLEDEL